MRTDRRTSAGARDQTAEFLKAHGFKAIGPDVDGDVLLSDKTLRQILDDCSQMQIRRLRESRGLPGPTLHINGRAYVTRSLFMEWLKARVEAGDDPRLPHHLKGRPSGAESAPT